MITDEELRRAAAAAEERLMASLPEPEDCEYEASNRFRRRMKGLIQRADHPVLFWAKRSAACFLLALLVGSAALLTFSTEARAAFFGWIKNSYDTYFIYEYSGDPPEVQEGVKYYPAWIPEGYWEAMRDEIDECFVFQNDEGQLITFSFAQKTSNTYSSVLLNFGEQGADMHRASVGEYPAEIYIAKDEDEQNAIVWTIDKDNTLLFISAFIDESELIKMAESVEVKN